MSVDLLASEPEFESDQSRYQRTVEGSGLSEVHAQKISELFRDEYAKLVHYMVAQTGSWPEARDIAAQAFAQVLEVRNPEAVSFLKAYVYRAARNLAIDRAKIGANRDRLNEFIRHEFADTTPSPEPLLMHQERLEILERAVQALRPARRAVLMYRLWDEFSYAEIESRLAADGIVVNERTLNRWYADALKEVRRALFEAEELKVEQLKREGRR
jgi:RNA polymerase sigma factor (sigma-70 family)